jgi:hypothetical protein
MQLGKLLSYTMPQKEKVSKLLINNTQKAIECIEKNQKETQDPLLWQRYEDELIILRRKLGELLNE